MGPEVAPRRRTARLRLWAAAAPWLLITGQSATGVDPDVLWVAAGGAAPIELADMRHPVQQWPADALLSQAVLPWRPARPRIDVTDVTLGLGAGTVADVSLVRVDPREVRFRLRTSTRSGGTLGAWSIANLSPDAILGLNAGQFEGGMPWGWLVRDGLEKTPPGHGPLSTAVVFDTAGGVHMVPWQEIPGHRFRRDVAAAFQSYPTILDGDGHVPDAVLTAGRGVDHAHRDVRLAFGTLADGRILIAITRFGETAGYSLPWGPTVPEMAALMGSLGSRRAVLLDGGLSAQFALRDSASVTRTWPAPRRVPLALEAIPR